MMPRRRVGMIRLEKRLKPEIDGGKKITIQAIFFDFDGVIVHSEHLKVEAFRNLYREHPADVVERVVAHHMAHAGISRVVKIKHAHKEFLNIDLTPNELDALCQKYSRSVEQQVVECESVDGALAFLIRAKDILKTFVVSGTPEDELRRITDKRGISGYFTGIYGSPRTKDDIVNELLDLHGLTAANCLFIGDAMTDYNAAQICKMPFLGRVNPDEDSPFPDGTDTVPHLSGLAKYVKLHELEGDKS